MGCSISKQEKSSSRRHMKMKSNEQRRRATRREVDEKERVTLALKMAETEWKKERKRLREEVKRLRQKIEENEETKAQQHEWEWVVEQMCLERAVREEAVERWKQLYFTIKDELDDLIHTTYGEALRWKPEQDSGKTVLQELKKEVKVRGETIETLRERIALMEKHENGKDIEIDLLRHSLRILGGSSRKSKTPSSVIRNLPIFIACK